MLPCGKILRTRGLTSYALQEENVCLSAPTRKEKNNMTKTEIYTTTIDEINTVLDVVEESNDSDRYLKGIAVIHAIMNEMERAIKENHDFSHLKKETFERIINS